MNVVRTGIGQVLFQLLQALPPRERRPLPRLPPGPAEAEQPGARAAGATQTGNTALKRMQRLALEQLSGPLGLDYLGHYLAFEPIDGGSLPAMYATLHELGLTHVQLYGFFSPTRLRSVRSELEGHGVDLARVVLTRHSRASLLSALDPAGELRKASVIAVGAQKYEPLRELLSFCRPLIRGELALFLDGYRRPECGREQQRALSDFLGAHPDLSASELGSYAPGAACFLLRRHYPV